MALLSKQKWYFHLCRGGFFPRLFGGVCGDIPNLENVSKYCFLGNGQVGFGGFQVDGNKTSQTAGTSKNERVDVSPNTKVMVRFPASHLIPLSHVVSPNQINDLYDKHISNQILVHQPTNQPPP